MLGLQLSLAACLIPFLFFLTVTPSVYYRKECTGSSVSVRRRGSACHSRGGSSAVDAATGVATRASATRYDMVLATTMGK